MPEGTGMSLVVAWRDAGGGMGRVSMVVDRDADPRMRDGTIPARLTVRHDAGHPSRPVLAVVPRG